jgi:holo-[acyl-carrier protein] synthase
MFSESESIHGIGIEIIELSQIKQAVSKWPSTLGERLFTAGEIKYCLEFFNSLPQFAMRFAAKEAYIKALKQPWVEGMKWTDIEIKIDNSGAPNISVSGKTKEIADSLDIMKNFVTTSHTAEYAVSQVLLTRLVKKDETNVG